MTHTLRRWTGALAACALIGLAGCGQPQPAGGRDHVRIALNWFPEPEHGGFYAALVHGYYQEAGLDVEILPGGPDVPLLQQVAAGQVTFGVENADLILIGRAAGVPVQSVLAPIQVSPRCIMVHEESGITRLEDLRDLTLAMSPQNPFYHYLLRRVPLTGVTVVPYPGSVARFLVDKNYGQQGYVFSEPLLARREGARPRSLLLSEIGFNPYTSTLFCTDELARTRPDLVRRVVAASIRGWQQYLRDPAATQRRLQELNPEMTPDVLAGGLEALRPLVLPAGSRPESIGRMSAARWDELLAQLEECGVVPGGKTTAAAAYSLDFLPVPAGE
ncbi:MAG: ABC transporter substrate-binding protein [Candidatus Delongbacteria bacterium]